jgi:tetratricopeptide (TPR) repeat protein
MMKVSPLLILALMLTVCFTLATGIGPRAETWSNRNKSDNSLDLLLGDGRRLFANQFFTMADVYFHSGYYPSIFDRAGKDSEIAAASHGHTDSPEDEIKEDFLGKPKDWIDAFGRNFRITQHTHLENGNEREILPWLRLAAEMDPQMIETYTVGSFWLREHLNQPQQAEAFLREGLRANPNSYEILFELGRLYSENYHDTARARNVWELAARRWNELDDKSKKDNTLALDEITVHLANLEENSGNPARAVQWLQAAQKVSNTPWALQKQIDDLKAKIPAATNAPAALPQ